MWPHKKGQRNFWVHICPSWWITRLFSGSQEGLSRNCTFSWTKNKPMQVQQHEIQWGNCLRIQFNSKELRKKVEEREQEQWNQATSHLISKSNESHTEAIKVISNKQAFLQLVDTSARYRYRYKYRYRCKRRNRGQQLILEVYEQLGLLLFFFYFYFYFLLLLSLLRGHGLMNKYSSNINSTAATSKARQQHPATMIMK